MCLCVVCLACNISPPCLDTPPHCRREEVLNKARAERAARTAAKQQQRAATSIQSAWRSHWTRNSLCSAQQQHWQASYAAAAAQPDVQLPHSELTACVRLCLQAVLPLGCSNRSKRVLSSGQPLSHIHACIRGTIALVLRSMSSSQLQDRYTAPAFSTDAQVRGVAAADSSNSLTLGGEDNCASHPHCLPHSRCASCCVLPPTGAPVMAGAGAAAVSAVLLSHCSWQHARRRDGCGSCSPAAAPDHTHCLGGTNATCQQQQHDAHH